MNIKKTVFGLYYMTHFPRFQSSGNHTQKYKKTGPYSDTNDERYRHPQSKVVKEPTGTKTEGTRRIYSESLHVKKVNIRNQEYILGTTTSPLHTSLPFVRYWDINSELENYSDGQVIRY